MPEYQANAVRSPNIHCHKEWTTVLGAGLSGILYYGLGFWFYVTGLRHVPASYAGAFLPLIPVFGVAAAFCVHLFFLLLAVTLITNRLAKATKSYAD